jgi:hypothetical protein
MSYQLSWHIEKRVILLSFPEEVTVNSAQDAGNKIRDYLEGGEAPVHFVIDMRKIRLSPTGLQTNLNLANSILHPNLGWVVTIGGTPVTTMMMILMAQIKRFKLHQTDSEAAALDFLQNKDESLKLLI